MRHSRRLVIGIILVVTVASLGNAGYHMLQLLLLEARGGFDGIAYIYLTMARGILNGLRPYADLYDSKPPGMYLVSIASLLLTRGTAGGMVMQIVLFLLLPMLLAVFGFWETGKNTDFFIRFFVTALGFLLGSLLFFYLEDRSGGYMAESFGACIGCLYLFHVFLRRDTSAPSAIILNAILLLGTFGFKEPFVISMTAAALLLARDAKHFRFAFLYPLLLSLVLGAATLTALGWLPPYLSYVHRMVGGRIVHGRNEALWMRGLAAARLFGNMTKSYSAPLFGILIGCLLLFVPSFRNKTHDRKKILRSAGAVAASIAFMILTGVALVFHPDYPLLPFALPRMIAALGAITLLVFLFKAKVSSATILTAVALFLVCIAVGAAEYEPSHFGFALPIFFALALLFLRYASHEPLSRFPIVIVASLVLVTSLFFHTSPGHFRFLMEHIQVARSLQPAVAERFDMMMDHCGFTNYFNDDNRVELALSRRSPLGPLFSIGEHSWYLAPDDPLVTQTVRNIRDRAQVLIIKSGEGWKMNNAVWGAKWGTVLTFFPELQPVFTTDVPPCARSFLPFDTMKVYFRKTTETKK